VVVAQATPPFLFSAWLETRDSREGSSLASWIMFLEMEMERPMPSHLVHGFGSSYPPNFPGSGGEGRAHAMRDGARKHVLQAEPQDLVHR